jgi:ABC-type antimicrobial peptide transport system permease subunit
LLFQTSSLDPAVLGGSAAVMIVVAVAATLFPAQAASRVNPSELLRS